MKEYVQIHDNTLEVTDEDSSVSFKIFPAKKQFKQIFNCRSSDCLEIDGNYKILEYKITNDPVCFHLKLIEESDSSGYGLIKDGVVLESEVLKEQGNNQEWAEKRTAYLKTLTEWCEASILSLNYYEVIFYLLSKHPEILPETEYRKFLRQTSENIKSALARIDKVFNNNDLEMKVKKSDVGYTTFWYKEFPIVTGSNSTYSDAELGKKIIECKELINLMFDEKSDSFVGINQDVFWESDLILKFIDNILSESEKLFCIEGN